VAEKIKIPKEYDVIFVGGGAAGCFGAIHAARLGAKVAIFERNGNLGKKLRITGKGRCNLTNNCNVDELMKNIPHNPRFLHSVFSHITPANVMDFFEELGVPLKTERGRRVFPESD
jgi:predicted flavoprotein YhiN